MDVSTEQGLWNQQQSLPFSCRHADRADCVVRILNIDQVIQTEVGGALHCQQSGDRPAEQRSANGSSALQIQLRSRNQAVNAM